MDGETIFAIVLGGALAVFSLIMAGYPVLRDAFFRPASRDGGDGALAEAGDDAGVGLESIYDAMDTLELEYQLGNLPEAEYRRQLQAYRLEAAGVIKAQWERGGESPDVACPECDAPIPVAHRGACPGCGAARRR